ncbi:helix-turn-helix domain-containing protein [Paenarthrobacter sp. NPDC057355]|uniref:helix-turn-helix domain-containing protein n=1 Tax=Paenarthrobacter sp. NPDC057355 TaxID=3346105 RepID=UPI00362D71DB
MSTQPMFVFRFEMDLADRMRKALRVSDVSVQEIADVVGMNRNTISAWINGRAKPNDRQLAAFAMRTGAPIDWLKTGDYAGQGGPNDGGPLESNTGG